MAKILLTWKSQYFSCSSNFSWLTSTCSHPNLLFLQKYDKYWSILRVIDNSIETEVFAVRWPKPGHWCYVMLYFIFRHFSHIMHLTENINYCPLQTTLGGPIYVRLTIIFLLFFLKTLRHRPHSLSSPVQSWGFWWSFGSVLIQFFPIVWFA